jgi:hypothetical protein
MSTQVLHAPLDLANIGPASRYIREMSVELLDHEKELLAALRFSIILTSRWVASEDEALGRRAELRGELKLLRNHYHDKIDEIAMTFGVQQAIETSDEVERTVVVPLELKPIPIKTGGQDDGDGYAEEDWGL